MQFTLKQACTALATYAHDHTAPDLVSAINGALLSLSALDAWDRLRKVIRLRVKGSTFSLPQDAASVVRACVNGRPSTVLGQNFMFLSSGPGDLSKLPTGYQWLDPGVLDLGLYPTQAELPGPSHLVAYVPDNVYVQQPNLVVSGHLENGELRTVHLPVAKKVDILQSVETYVTDVKFVDITSVVLDGTGTAYVYLFATPDKANLWKASDRGITVGQFHPAVAVPEFHRYKIPGAKEDKTYELMLEVRISPLPLVEDTDVIPLPTLEPLRHLLMANYYFSLGEVDTAAKYQNMAIQFMKALEITEEKKQTFVVNNMLYPNSLGEMSDEYAFL